MPLKIAITFPNIWPYVRRGAERYVYELSRFLSAKGYYIDLITSKPGFSKIIEQENVNLICHKYLQHPLLLQCNISRSEGFAVSSLYSLLKNRYDLVYSLWYSDGFAGSINRLIKGTQYIFHIIHATDIADFKQKPLAEFMFRRAIYSSSKCIVPSKYIYNNLFNNYNVAGEIISPPIDTEVFQPLPSKSNGNIKILFASSLYDPQKGISLLINGFELFHQKYPESILLLAGPAKSSNIQNILANMPLSIRNSIRLYSSCHSDRLRHLYADSTMTVLPSVNEPFGMVLIESLASGTPVVGTRSGGIPEIITDDKVGTLFDIREGEDCIKQARSLCDAMFRTLELSRKPDTIRICRQHAMQFSWKTIGNRIDHIIHCLLS